MCIHLVICVVVYHLLCHVCVYSIIMLVSISSESVCARVLKGYASVTYTLYTTIYTTVQFTAKEAPTHS